MELCKRCHLLYFGDKSLLYQVKNMEFCLKANYFIRTTNRTTATACKQVFFLRHHMCCQFVRCKLWFKTKYQYKTLDGKKLVLCFEWLMPYRECDQAYANRWYLSSVQSAKPIKLNKTVGKVPWNLNSRNLKSLIYWRGDTILPTAGSDNGEYDQTMGGMWSWNEWHLHKKSHFNIHFFCFM